jgi:hypothetical protein
VRDPQRLAGSQRCLGDQKLIPPCSPCLRERPNQRRVFISQRHQEHRDFQFIKSFLIPPCSPCLRERPFQRWVLSHRDTKNTKILNASILLIPPCSPCLRERPIQRRFFPSQRHQEHRDFQFTKSSSSLRVLRVSVRDPFNAGFYLTKPLRAQRF